LRIFGFRRRAPRQPIAHDREPSRKTPVRAPRSTSQTPSRTHIGRAPKDKIHPATRVFQALRIFVSDELGRTGQGVAGVERALKPGGRLAVVTFHSLEDRIVKALHRRPRRCRDRLAAHARGKGTHGNLQQGRRWGDAGRRPRSPPIRAARSARLRAAIRTGRQPAPATFDLRPSKTSRYRSTGRGENVFRTSDIVLIAVMVSAATLTYKTKREARNNWRR
jgi:hypothetical protein